MTKGPNRMVLDQYLDTAAEGSLRGAGYDWKKKAKDLKTDQEVRWCPARQGRQAGRAAHR